MYEIFTEPAGWVKTVIKSGREWRDLPTPGNLGTETEIGLILDFIILTPQSWLSTEIKTDQPESLRDTSQLCLWLDSLWAITEEDYFYHIKQTEGFWLAQSWEGKLIKFTLQTELSWAAQPNKGIRRWALCVDPDQL